MDFDKEVASENMNSESADILEGLDQLEESEQNLEDIGPDDIVEALDESQNWSEGEDDNLEMLDMLCDGIEAE